MSCSYRSITLQPGESYVLPAGAQIISATDSNTITSVNSCANLDNLEDLVCIEINWATQPDNGGGTSPWSVVNQDTECIGIGVNGVDYDFSSPTSGDDYVLIKTRINEIISISGIANCYSSFFVASPTSERDVWGIKIQTISSLADSIYLRFQVENFDPVRVYGEITICP